MNKTYAVFFLLVLGFVSFSTEARADIYPSNLRVTNPDSVSAFDGNLNDGSNVFVWYTLNDKADTVVVWVKSGSTIIRTWVLSDSAHLARGEHYVTWDGRNDNTGAAAAGTYTFSVKAKQNAGYASWTMFYDSGDINIFTRGVDVNSDPMSQDFGFIFAGNNTTSTSSLGRGILRMRADGAQAGDTLINGFKYCLKASLTAPFSTGTALRHRTPAIDDMGRVYIADLDSGKVWRFTPPAGPTELIISGVKWPHGLAVMGSGPARTLYFGVDSAVIRAQIGDTAPFAGKLDTLVQYTSTFRVVDVVVDDGGFLYVNVRNVTAASKEGSAGGGGWTEKYDITGGLPKLRSDTSWTVAWTGSRPVGLSINRGANASSNSDDKLYASVAEGVYGVWELMGISGTPTATKVFDPPIGDISRYADLTVDALGNVILFENSNEHVYFVSPPTGTNTYTTNSAAGVTIVVSTPVGVELVDNTVPDDYSLRQNYPNPFNPTTTIEFRIPVASSIRLVVYDILGKEISVLREDNVSAGHYKAVFDAKNLASGTYFYVLRAGNVVLRNKMVLLK